MSVNKGISILFFLFWLSLPAFAQKSKAQLQKEKKENLEKIAEAEKILTETKGKKQNTIGQLNALNQRIKTQEDLMSSIRNELAFLSDDIDENNEIIASLSEDLKNLKQEYAAMVYSAYKANQGINKLTFLFSASSFHQFLMRLNYMKQYSDARLKQAEQIAKVQKTLTDQVATIQGKVNEKNALLAENLKENKSLENLKENKNELVSNLQKQENQIKKDLEERKVAVAKLDKLINDIIKAEIERARLAEKSASDASTKLSNEFAENKSKLPWPVSGFVSQRFGKQPHPVLKGIVIQSNGIHIQTKANEKVQAAFTGEVSRVAFVKHLGNTIIINHGGYFTVYSRLKDVFVTTGQKVLVGQELGTVLTNIDGVSELTFELYKSTTPIDPQQWLVRK